MRGSKNEQICAQTIKTPDLFSSQSLSLLLLNTPANNFTSKSLVFVVSRPCSEFQTSKLSLCTIKSYPIQTLSDGKIILHNFISAPDLLRFRWIFASRKKQIVFVRFKFELSLFSLFSSVHTFHLRSFRFTSFVRMRIHMTIYNLYPTSTATFITPQVPSISYGETFACRLLPPQPIF